MGKLDGLNQDPFFINIACTLENKAYGGKRLLSWVAGQASHQSRCALAHVPDTKTIHSGVIGSLWLTKHTQAKDAGGSSIWASKMTFAGV